MVHQVTNNMLYASGLFSLAAFASVATFGSKKVGNALSQSASFVSKSGGLSTPLITCLTSAVATTSSHKTAPEAIKKMGSKSNWGYVDDRRIAAVAISNFVLVAFFSPPCC